MRLVAVSRTGLLPVPHRWPEGPIALGYQPPAPGTSLHAQVRAFRAATVASRARGGDARDVVDALRPHTHAIWQGFSRAEQRRFLGAYTRFWAINRNRMAPAAAGWVESLRASGQLAIVTGAVVAAESAGGRLRVTLRRRGETAADVREFDAAVNCVGPADAPFGAGSPLYDRLLADGLVRPIRSASASTPARAAPFATPPASSRQRSSRSAGCDGASCGSRSRSPSSAISRASSPIGSPWSICPLGRCATTPSTRSPIRRRCVG